MNVADRTVSIEPKRPRRLQLGVRRLLFLVACCAALLGAWRFSRENLDGERAMASRQVDRLGRGEDPLTRMAAAESLGQVRPGDVGMAAGALAGALSDTDPRVRAAAARALGTVFHRAISGPGDDVAGPRRSAVRGLLAAIRDRDATVRAAAARALATLTIPYGPNRIPPSVLDPRVVVPELIEAIHDPEPTVRVAVVLALGVVAPKSGDAPPALMAALDEDPDRAVRAEAARALGQPWRDADAVFLALLERLDVPDRVTRVAVYRSLPNLGPAPIVALPVLIQTLEDRDNDLARDMIPPVLTQLGPAAKAALPALADVAKQQVSAGDRLSAVEALIAIAPDSPEAQSLLAPLVEAVLHADRGGSRGQAAVALSGFGPFARAAIAPLRAARSHPDADVRSVVEWVLWRIDVAREPPSSE